MSPNPEPPATADDYFLEIEAHFAARRGTPFVFSAKDWMLMKGWHDEGVPLPVIIEAIDTCFDKSAAAGRKRTISSLSYCRHAVKEIWSERKDLAVGASSSVPESDPLSQADALASELLAASARSEGRLAEVLRDAAAAVRALASGKSVPQIEEALLELEDRLLGECVESLSADMAAAVRGQVESHLAAAGIRDAAVLERTRAAVLKRAVRAAVGIPRLSLFG